MIFCVSGLPDPSARYALPRVSRDRRCGRRVLLERRLRGHRPSACGRSLSPFRRDSEATANDASPMQAGNETARNLRFRRSRAVLAGSPGWTRTNNPPVNSRMLCQLSYRGSVQPAQVSNPAARGKIRLAARSGRSPGRASARRVEEARLRSARQRGAQRAVSKPPRRFPRDTRNGCSEAPAAAISGASMCEADPQTGPISCCAASSASAASRRTSGSSGSTPSSNS